MDHREDRAGDDEPLETEPGDERETPAARAERLEASREALADDVESGGP